MRMLAFVALFVTNHAFGQQKAIEPFAGADEVAVVVPDSGIAAWHRVARGLAMRGYQFQTRDSVAFRLVSPMKTAVPAGRTAMLQVIVMGHTVLLTAIIGFTNRPETQRLRIPYPHYGNFFSIPDRWAELDAVAKGLQGQVFYHCHP